MTALQKPAPDDRDIAPIAPPSWPPPNQTPSTLATQAHFAIAAMRAHAVNNPRISHSY